MTVGTDPVCTRPNDDWFQASLRCPCAVHHSLAVGDGGGTLRCTNPNCPLPPATRIFPVVDGQPVLVDFANSVLDETTTLEQKAPPLLGRPRGLRERLSRIVFGSKRQASRNAGRLAELLRTDGRKVVVLVIGGATVGEGIETLYREAGIKIVAFDIYRSSHTQLVADAHSIPLADGIVDGVWIQAVLEHVLAPEQVVREIFRVLRPGGLVYAETPFMQQVHEGPYDFMRFTESGHRWLFRRFERIDSGVERGPFTVLIWSIRYALTGLLRSRNAATAICTALFWLRYLDNLVPSTYAIDGASEVYFLGRKSEATLHPKEVITRYLGAQSALPPSSSKGMTSSRC
jgi:SAM-dependent methyltransferase